MCLHSLTLDFLLIKILLGEYSGVNITILLAIYSFSSDANIITLVYVTKYVRA